MKPMTSMPAGEDERQGTIILGDLASGKLKLYWQKYILGG